MKKFILIVLLIFIAAGANTQDSLESKSNIYITIGRSFPVGDFSSDNINKINAGFAENGFVISATYSYQFDELFGLSSAFVYGRYSVNLTNNESAVPIKPWEYYEFLIGPMMTGSVAKNMALEVCIMTGTVFINAPKVNANGVLVAKKYPASAVPLYLATDFRFYFTNKWCFHAGIAYNYIRANFNVTFQSQELSFKQSMNSVSVKAGVGFSF